MVLFFVSFSFSSCLSCERVSFLVMEDYGGGSISMDDLVEDDGDLFRSLQKDEGFFSLSFQTILKKK